MHSRHRADLDGISSAAPIDFVSVDVDYYSSARDALSVFLGAPDKYLPIVPVHFDDLGDETVNPWVGDALAINEFNEKAEFRKTAPHNMLRERRICKNAKWIKHAYALHVHDHRLRTPSAAVRPRRIIDNEYLVTSSGTRGVGKARIMEDKPA